VEAITDTEKERREFWMRVFETAKSLGLKPENAAGVADGSLKQLKSRDEETEFEW
jgi:hypothetical protein